MSRGVAAALLSALLFGASTPIAKLLLDNLSPWLLAGLLYLGSGVGLTILRWLHPSRRASLKGREWLWMAAAAAAGGIVGPLLLMWGLSMTSAASASLLLNAESVFTALLAWFAFRESFAARVGLGIVAILAGAVFLSGTDASAANSLWGPLAVLGACFCWGLDNNLTRKVSLSDPVQIAAIKGLVAGTTNTALALMMEPSLPGALSVSLAALVGFLGYGVSITLFVVALRELGSARAGAFFSVAPFVGAVVAILLLGEPLTARLLVAGALMGIGVWLLLTEVHEHEHAHDAIEHDHPHSHDEHHRHDHDQAAAEPHSHPHRHETLRHRHPHHPDAHHRHGH